MKKLKTMKDLLDMKNMPCPPFENAYVYFFKDLENNYLSKVNGSERNEYIINQYDEETQKFIRSKLKY